MRIILCLSCLLLTTLSANCGTLRGKVTTASGRPLAGVPVVIQQPGSVPVRIQTSSTGIYVSPKLGSGRYTATFGSKGYGSKRIIDIVISSTTKDLLLDVQLDTAGTWGSSISTHLYMPREYTPETRRGHSGSTKDAEEYYPWGGKSGSRYGLRRAYTGEFLGNFKRGRGDVMGVAGGLSDDVRPVPSKPAGAPHTTRYEEVRDAASPALAFKSSESVAIAAPVARAGSLTSGEINDFAKWTLWEDVSMEELKAYRAAWPLRPEARYTVIVKSREGRPLVNAHVSMKDGRGAVWETMTDNTGKAELWYGMYTTDANPLTARLSATIDYGREHYSMPLLKPFAEGTNILNTKIACLNPAKLDIAFIVDATGSMQDEINYLKAELRDILQKVQDSMPATQVQTAALFYRDVTDAYLTRASDLTSDFAKTEAFIADNNADGGGDFPEAVDAALEAGLSDLHWRTDATARLAFLVLDAPPHSDSATVKKIQQLAAQYAVRGIRLIPVVCSGSDKPTEYLMRTLALATNGTYLFLTNHSGIGGAHTAPTTDNYDVEYLNGLIYRVIYQYAYMPDCNTSSTPTDITQVRQPTDSASAIAWRYYPNPTSGILHIEHTHTSGFLLITDVTGKAVLRVSADASGTTTIDMGQYPSGLYAIRYNWEADKWMAGKFMLVH